MAERKLEIVFLGSAKPAQDAMRQVGESTGGLQAKVGGQDQRHLLTLLHSILALVQDSTPLRASAIWSVPV